jgi:hypothetical protein
MHLLDGIEDDGPSRKIPFGVEIDILLKGC